MSLSGEAVASDWCKKQKKGPNPRHHLGQLWLSPQLQTSLKPYEGCVTVHPSPKWWWRSFTQRQEGQEAPLGEGWGVGLTPDMFSSISKPFTGPFTNSFPVPQMGETFLYLFTNSQRLHGETKDDSSSEIKVDEGLNVPEIKHILRRATLSWPQIEIWGFYLCHLTQLIINLDCQGLALAP